jgi:hypothetical protein
MLVKEVSVVYSIVCRAAMLTGKVAILFKSLPAFFVAGRIPACVSISE